MRAAAIDRPATRAFGGIALLSVAALAGALVSQHVYGMEPCPWCVLQRVVVAAIAIVAVIGTVWRGGFARRALAAPVLALALCGAAAALWQHFRAAASASCNLTLADRIVSGLGLDAMLPAVFEPRASCADAAVKLLGVPYDFWSLGLFALLAVASAWLLVRPTPRGLR